METKLPSLTRPILCSTPLHCGPNSLTWRLICFCLCFFLGGGNEAHPEQNGAQEHGAVVNQCALDFPLEHFNDTEADNFPLQ